MEKNIESTGSGAYGRYMYEIMENGSIRVPITQEMIAIAIADADRIGVLKRSRRGWKATFIGTLGELASLAYMGGATRTNTYDHDLIWNGVRFEVKTKDRTWYPNEYRDAASVAAYNTRQVADLYAFVSLMRDEYFTGDFTQSFTDAFLMGVYPQKDYKANAVRWYEGDIDPINGWKCDMDCYNMRYIKLNLWATPSF